MKTVLTNNGMGHSFLESDPIRELLREYGANGKNHILDIGAGVGVNTLIALSSGNNVIANDMAQSHLNIIKRKALEIKDEKSGNLSLMRGLFPGELHFKPAQFNAIAAFQMFHFLKPEQIDNGLKKIYSWLKPGGKLFLTVTSPYIKGFERFMPIYHRRLLRGDPFPGQFSDVRSRIPEEFRDQYPNYMNFMDENIVRKMVPQDKFEIEVLMSFKAKSDSPLIKLDGRENIGLILRKK